MSVVTLIVTLVVLGFVMWLIGFIPMDNTIRRILQVAVVIIVVLWLLQGFGILPHLGRIRVSEIGASWHTVASSTLEAIKVSYLS